MLELIESLRNDHVFPSLSLDQGPKGLQNLVAYT